MSTYNGRRAPNVSQYLANLNAIPSAQEIAAQNDLSIGDDGLDFLTNTQFFDFDEFHQTAADHESAGNVIHQSPQSADSSLSPAVPAQYQFGEFQTFLSPSSPQSATGGLPYPGAAGQPAPHHFPATGDKRKASVSLPTTADLEEASRFAAEEDKRRRNTAASARFRVKKKQREQALEKQAKEMTDKVSQLEGKIQQLEMENKWLKGLITEKSDSKTIDASIAGKIESEERKPEKRSDGVGTEVDEE